VKKVDKIIDILERDFKAMSGKGPESWDLYDAETLHELPVGVQILGRKFEDENGLEVAEYISQECGLPFDASP
jgi:hypothetical protein